MALESVTIQEKLEQKFGNNVLNFGFQKIYFR